MAKKENTLHDESLLGDLFEDFEGKKDEKNKNKKPDNTILIKVIILILLMLIVGGGYYYFIKGNSNADTNVVINKEISLLENESNNSNINQEVVVEDNNKQEVELKYNDFAPLLSTKSWGGNDLSRFSDTWGEENIIKISDSSLQINYPKGSFKPSIDPRGGAGFKYNIENKSDELTLVYEVEFADNFDFVKGGKLPGLCGGNCARGIDGENDSFGFSTRLSWRSGGSLGSLLNIPGSSKYGDLVTAKDFNFESGKKYLIAQKIKLNTPDNNDGVLELKVNGKTIYFKDDIQFRVNSDIKIDALLFTTFFGGNDLSFATPNDTHIKFANFNIR